MKKVFFVFVFFIIAVFFISSNGFSTTGKKLTPEQIKQAMIQNGGIPKESIYFVKKVKTNSQNWEAYLFHIKQGNMKQPLIIFVDNKGNAVFGRIFNNFKTITPNFSPEDLTPVFDKIDTSKLNIENRIILNPEGKKTMFMFYSPECSHCKEAMKKLANYKGEYKIVVKFMVPPNTPSKAKEEMTDYLVKNKQLSKEEAEKLASKLIEEDFKEGLDIGVMGTPMFFDEKGQYHAFVPDAKIN